MNNASFDWDLVRSFLAALEHGSLLGAARALKTSQPTMGRRIAELETQLGTTLFERTGRGLRPTAMALELADAARQMEQAALQLRLGLAQSQDSLRGTVRLSASTTVSCLLLPPLLAELRERLPEVQVELVSTNAVSNLLRREADIALRMVRPQQSTLIARRVAQVTLGIYGHSDYLRRRGVPRQPEQLLDHELIGLDQDDAIIRGFGQFGYSLDKEAFGVRCDDFIAQWELVRAGLGLGFIANYVALRDPAVQRVLPSFKLPAMPLWLAVHRELRSTPRIRAVYDFLAEALARPELGLDAG